MQKQRKAHEEEVMQDQKGKEEYFLAGLIHNDTTEELGIQLHHTLKLYPQLRDRWLSGEALASLLDESKCGMLLLPELKIVQVDGQHQRLKEYSSENSFCIGRTFERSVMESSESCCNRSMVGDNVSAVLLRTPPQQH
jgi:hypothetical protein